MKNKTRRPTLIIHSAPKQTQQGHFGVGGVLDADSPFAYQYPTPGPQLILILYQHVKWAYVSPASNQQI